MPSGRLQGDEGPPSARPSIIRHRGRRGGAPDRRHRRQLIGAVCVLVLVWSREAIRVRTADSARRPVSGGEPQGGRKTTSTPAPPPSTPRARLSPGDGDLFDDPAVAAYLAGTTQDVTAAVYDGVTGHTSLYRPGVAQDTASIMKADILATLSGAGPVDRPGAQCGGTTPEPRHDRGKRQR